ncbi:MAG: DpnII family type II restriction endonuclease [Capnocytophaga sp.]|nr:DpnII family type II restriction endonuclease [Capnocytophaga sp.]
MNTKKYQTVIDKNTFYFSNPIFQEKYDGYINSLVETLLLLKTQIENKGLQKSIFEELLENNENGLRALLALTGFANESLKRLITVIRVIEDKKIEKLLFVSKWNISDKEEIKEWGDNKIASLLKANSFFRKALVNLFFEGATIPFFVRTLPLFELKKLSVAKLRFEPTALIDTIVRYKEKGSLSGKYENNPEYLIASMLNELNITFEKGDLTELFKNEQVAKRTMDFIIPNKQNPQIIIESSFLVTTSSGQGDKSKTEGNIKTLIKKYYPEATFLGFVDGIGWYVRKGDLMRMVSAYDDVFTFHKTELSRFTKLIKSILK